MSELKQISIEVIQVMHTLPELAHLDLDALPEVSLGYLRRDAINRHAVCRYRRGVRRGQKVGPAQVRCVDLHPNALAVEWERYARFLLYHEYLHALGFTDHGREFRRLEALWPDREARSQDILFARMLRERNARWIWSCTTGCGIRYPRARRGNGRYQCRRCKRPLEDLPGPANPETQ